MKQSRVMIAAVLVLCMIFSGLAFAAPVQADGARSARPLADTLAAVGLPRLASGGITPTHVQTDLFRAKFEGSSVAGSGQAVNGAYRFTATETDGEAWHVKLEANYPTVSGRDYEVTYRFTSDVAGKVKFGDFQEFTIQKGENTVTGMMIASGGTSYLDLQLGMLPPFTIDFTEIEVKEFADEVSYENALATPVNFERESKVYEKHDQGYASILTRTPDSVELNYVATSWESGIWKSRLYIKTGLIPEAGVRYHITADISADNDFPFELLFNSDEVEKGYGALYGQSVTAGQTTTCEAVIIGGGDGDELVLQFSLGEVPEETKVMVENLRLEVIRDHYASQLPARFALDASVATGKMLTNATPTSYTNIPLKNFSYTSIDSISEGHDDGYEVSMTESGSSATMKITKAPANDRGVWKARLYAATGVTLQAGTTYRISFKLKAAKDQAEYEVCFDGDTENAYGALYGRSLSAGGTDTVEYLVTPTESQGPLTIRLQLGKTDSTAGNTFTLSDLQVESATVSYNSVLPASFSYVTGVNVFESHDNGYTQSVSASGGSATLSISAAPDSDRQVWKSRMVVHTGFTPQAGIKYQLSFDLNAAKAQAAAEYDFGGSGGDKDFDALYGQTLSAGKQTVTYTFTPSESHGELSIILLLGATDDASGNTITLSNMKIGAVTLDETGTSVLPTGFAYPTVTTPSTPSGEPGYREVTLGTLEAADGHDAGYDQACSGTSLTFSAVPTVNANLWNSKMWVATNAVPEANAKYRLSVSVSSAKAMDFELNLNNGGLEKGYGALYGQKINAGETKTLSCDFTAPADGLSNLVLQFMTGLSPAENSFTVNSITLQKVIPAHEENKTVPAGFQPKTISLSCAGNADYDHSFSGTTMSIGAINIEQGVWRAKIFADTQTVLEAGGRYRVNASLSSAKDMGYEICLNNGDIEKGYGALYGLSVGAGSSTDSSAEINLAADATGLNNLVLLFQLGNSPADNTITVNSVTLEKWEEEHQITETVPEAVENVELSITGVTEHGDDGYVQSLSGTTLTITQVPTLNIGVWSSKLWVNTNTVPEAGQKYRLTANVTSVKAMSFELDLNNGATEKGYGALYEQSIGANETKDLISEFTLADDAATQNLVLQFMLGLSPAGNTFTVNSVKLEKWSDGTEDTEPATPTVNLNSFSFWTHEDVSAAAGGDGSSANVSFSASNDTGSVWKTKLFANTGVTLQPGRSYRISANVSATNGFPYEICYNDGGTEKGVGARYGLNASAGGETVVYTASVNSEANLVLQFSVGCAPAGTTVTVRDIKVEELGESVGDNLINTSLVSWAPIHSWNHESYTTSLSSSGSSATMAITSVPGEGREAWKIKLFAETGAALEAGKTYRISADVRAASDLPFEICYNDGAAEKAVGAKYGLNANGSTQTVVFETKPEADATLTLQFNLGNAPAANSFTVSNIKVEEAKITKTVSTIADFRYDSVGYVSRSADPGYITSFTQGDTDATLVIQQAPAERNPWNVKLFIRTGFTPEKNKGYRVSFDLASAAEQDVFEVFYDGNSEAAYGSLTGQRLNVQKRSFTYTIMPGDSKGELTLQLRLGKTNSTAGNDVTVSNLKIEEVTFQYSQTPETRETTVLDNQRGYVSTLEKSPSRASVRIEKTPADGREAWKSKLFINTGATLRAGTKYRISMEVKSVIPTPFEVCFNNGAEEKGLGAMYGLISTPQGRYVEYVTYAKQDTQLVLQLSLGNCQAPNTLVVSNVSVEKAGGIELVSDTIYSF